MRTTVATLLLLVLAAVATGGEARSGDGGSARQLLTHPEPPSCKYPNCHDVRDYKCDWLPKAHPKCDYDGKKYHVPVKNCFKKHVSYISISVGDECYEFPKPHGDYIGTLELGCGDNITIHGYDKYKLKGDGSKCCNHEGKKDCKTCEYTDTYDCGYPAKPGDKCHKAKGDCALPSEYDHECKCTKKFKDKYTVCRPAHPDHECDVPENCTGYTPYCPVEDAVKPNGTICGYKDPHKPCDADDTCDGYSKKCFDKVAKAGTVCRPAKGPCDAAEVCDGDSKDCPKDCCVYDPKVKEPYCPVKYI